MRALGSAVFYYSLVLVFYAVFCLAQSPIDAPEGFSLDDQDESESGLNETKEPFRFHYRGARNIIVSDDGRAVYRRMRNESLLCTDIFKEITEYEAENLPACYISDFGHSAALTRRILNPGEIFEVWVDSLEYVEHPRIGVTTQTPDKIDYPDYMNHLREGTWGWDVWPNQIYQEGEIIKEPYQGKRDIQRGDRYGVSVTDDGTLHFHYNGRNLGPAAKNVMGSLYGYVDLYWQGSNATIVE